MVELDADAVLCALEQQYRASRSEVTQAKARYVAVMNGGTANAAALRNAYAAWKDRDSRCRVLAHRLDVLRRRISA